MIDFILQCGTMKKRERAVSCPEAKDENRVVLLFTHGLGVFVELANGKLYRAVDGELIRCITKPHQFPETWY